MSDYSVGVEEEYQLVDWATGELRSRARHVLAGDWSAEIRKELQETTVEVGTRVCASAAELDAELRRLRFQAATAAAAEGLEIVAAGIHPFSRWEAQERTPDPRYRAIEGRVGRIARDEHIFGMHIHVAVPSRRRVRLMNRTREILPLLVAAAASSPFFENEDTGYDSYRAVLWRRWPLAGVPPRCNSDADLRRLIDVLLESGALSDERSIYWSLRPHPEYPTLEFRITDSCPLVDDAVAIAALVRAAVAAAAEGALRDDARGGLSEGARDEVLRINDWRAARYGLGCALVDPAAPGGVRPLRDALRRLAERVALFAEQLGDGAALEGVAALLERGNGADRLRRLRREGVEMRDMVRWLAGETILGTGLDRREAQRERPA